MPGSYRAETFDLYVNAMLKEYQNRFLDSELYSGDIEGESLVTQCIGDL